MPFQGARVPFCLLGSLADHHPGRTDQATIQLIAFFQHLNHGIGLHIGHRHHGHGLVQLDANDDALQGAREGIELTLKSLLDAFAKYN